jgi:hypothetical protein
MSKEDQACARRASVERLRQLPPVVGNTMLEVTEFMAGVARFGVGRVRIVEDCVRISGESDHPFRLNPTTCFGGIRPGISVESDHLFR